MNNLGAATPERPVRLGPYDVIGLLGEGGMGRVHEAVHREHGVRVALKTLVHMAPENLLRFKAEFRSVAGLSHPNLVPLYELGCEGDLWFFTMELVDGTDFLAAARGETRDARLDETEDAGGDTTLTVPIAALRARGEGRPAPIERSPSLPPSLPTVRDLLLQLVRGVHALHEAGLVHLDLKPSNVLVDRSGRVVVLDFGLVQPIHEAPPEESESGVPSRVSAQSPQVTPRSRTLRGTPAWMAPEQFLGGEVGEAADWYAVGLMLYEALTGVPAFPQATTTATWYARQHIPPTAPHELVSGVPADLSALAVALLRPDPADRPSGAALIDLLAGDDSQRARAATAIARSDLVGREEERAILTAAFERVRVGGFGMVHVTGPSGVGKSALLQSFAGQARGEGALVLTGRCYEREKVPYKAVDGIVDELAARLAARPEAEVEVLLPRWTVELSHVFPALATVPAIVADLDRAGAKSWAAPAMEQRRRAVRALCDLLAAVSARQPLVLIVDDLHWADADSVDVLRGILAAAPPGTLLAASFRAEEAAASPALAPYLELSRASGAVVSIETGVLPAAAARALAGDTLRALGVTADGLSEAIAAESGGIPFFVEELAHFVARQGGGGAASLPAEGVTLETVLARRVQDLPAPERALVEALSVADSPIPLSVWFAVAGVEGGALRALWALRGRHMVRSTGASAGDRIELHHDRMRQSVLRYMPRDQIVEVHLRLGRALRALVEEDASSPWLFDAVRHLGEAAPLLTGAERIDAARLHLVAGRRARDGAAFPLAFACYQTGARLLGDRAFEDHYDLALALHSGAAESAYLSGAFDALGAHLGLVKARARGVLDQIVAREVEIDALIAQKDYAGAVEAALASLRLLDVDLPADPGGAEIGAAVQSATESLARVGVEGLLSLPMADDPRATAAMRLESRISSAAYFARPALFPVIACRLVAASVAHGVSASTPYALAVYGIVLNAAGMLREAHAWGQAALRLLDRIPDKSHEARTRHVVHDLVCVFTVPLAGTLGPLRAVVEIGKETGDLEYAAYAAHAYVHNAFYAGRELGALLDEALSLGAFLRGQAEINALHVHVPFEQALRCFLGRTPDPASLDGEGFSEEAALEAARAVGSRSAQAIVSLLMGIVRYHFGAPGEASRHLERARSFLDGVASTWHVPILHQYAALAIWASPAATVDDALRARAEESLAALRRFADHGPENFALRVDLVEGTRARASGDLAAAASSFERAAAGAKAGGFLGDEGLAFELLARTARDQGAEPEAARYAEAARDAYRRWGASAKRVS